ncbi:MAG: aminopeptidase P family N-terminal domain-containing protein [Geminicoccaceae bacterium]
MTAALNPTILRPDDIDPNWRWDREIPAPGKMSVDFETRVDFRRLQKYRLGRAQAALEASGCGALLLFDVNNIRYVSGTKIGEWERDKLCRFALLTPGNEPVVWDFGSAAVHHKLYCDWLTPSSCRAGVLGMRGTIPPSFGLMKAHAEEIMSLLREAGADRSPVGVDLAETAMMFALQDAGLRIVDGQQIMLDAREIKNIDEIVLLNQAAAMVDGVYHMIWEELKPGVREADIVAKANAMLYQMGSDDVEAINAISGERCNPHPHNFTDRLLRPGDQAFFDILQATTAIAPATTGPSMSDGRRRCRTTPTSSAANGWTRPSSSSSPASPPTRSRASGRPPRSWAFRRAFRLRPAVRPWPRSGPARAADHQSCLLLRTAAGNQDRHGLRARNLLPG